MKTQHSSLVIIHHDKSILHRLEHAARGIPLTNPRIAWKARSSLVTYRVILCKPVVEGLIQKDSA